MMRPRIPRICRPTYTGCSRLCKYFKYICIRSYKFVKSRSIKIQLALCVTFILYLHMFVAPRAMGSYHDTCYLSTKEMRNMKFLLTGVTGAFNTLNVTYWLDFGTLLGVWKSGEILNYDGDIDIGRLFNNINEDSVIISKMEKLLKPHNITIDGFQAKYNGKTADLFRWKIHEKKINAKNITIQVLRKWYPFTETFGIVGDFVNYLMPAEVPFEAVLPTREISVYDTKMNIPNKPIDVIKIRYPLTWFISFPYKWKCWFQ